MIYNHQSEPYFPLSRLLNGPAFFPTLSQGKQRDETAQAESADVCKMFGVFKSAFTKESVMFMRHFISLLCTYDYVCLI